MKDYDVTDEQLIERLRAGEKEIIDFLMEKYKNLVRRKAKAMFLWGGESEDLIQEGMIGLFKAVQDYEPEEGTSFFRFAELCISRQMYTAIKASKRKKHIPLNSYISLYTEQEIGDEGKWLSLAETIAAGKESNPETRILEAEFVENMGAELRKTLSKLENKVLYLHLQGMDYHMIAAFIDRSPKTVDNALQRIRYKARKLMEDK